MKKFISIIILFFCVSLTHSQDSDLRKLLVGNIETGSEYTMIKNSCNQKILNKRIEEIQKFLWKEWYFEQETFTQEDWFTLTRYNNKFWDKSFNIMIWSNKLGLTDISLKYNWININIPNNFEDRKSKTTNLFEVLALQFFLIHKLSFENTEIKCVDLVLDWQSEVMSDIWNNIIDLKNFNNYYSANFGNSKITIHWVLTEIEWKNNILIEYHISVIKDDDLNRTWNIRDSVDVDLSNFDAQDWFNEKKPTNTRGNTAYLWYTKRLIFTFLFLLLYKYKISNLIPIKLVSTKRTLVSWILSVLKWLFYWILWLAILMFSNYAFTWEFYCWYYKNNNVCSLTWTIIIIWWIYLIFQFIKKELWK